MMMKKNVFRTCQYLSHDEIELHNLIKRSNKFIFANERVPMCVPVPFKQLPDRSCKTKQKKLEGT